MSPSAGVAVLHLFCHTTPAFDGEAFINAVKTAENSGVTVMTVAMLGHKADVGVMALASDLRDLKTLQTAVQHSGLTVSDSYFSITEVSEYAMGLPDEMRNARLYPTLPVPGKNAFCFYGMSKRRVVGANWFAESYERRKEMMEEHGMSGRKFGPRVSQLVTGSTGLDKYEWGVTLFGVHPDDLKDVVYTMRFDEASAQYGEFGDFYVGMLTPVAELVHQI